MTSGTVVMGWLRTEIVRRLWTITYQVTPAVAAETGERDVGLAKDLPQDMFELTGITGIVVRRGIADIIISRERMSDLSDFSDFSTFLLPSGQKDFCVVTLADPIKC